MITKGTKPCANLYTVPNNSLCKVCKGKLRSNFDTILATAINTHPWFFTNNLTFRNTPRFISCLQDFS